jgi:vacuolar-type H+-ATPase catalytic subunit A/Vma1
VCYSNDVPYNVASQLSTGLMGNIVDGIQRPLRVSVHFSRVDNLIQWDIVHPRTVQINLHPSRDQYRGIRSLDILGLHPRCIQGDSKLIGHG